MARLSGYASVGVLNPEEAAGHRKAVSMLLARTTSRAGAVRWLNSNGYRTTLGNEWRTETFVRTVSNPRMAGLDPDGNPLEGYEETVLTVDEYNQLMALFAELSGDQSEAREAYEYLLTSGLSECGQCQHAMTGARVGGDLGPSYRCPAPVDGRPSCGRVRMNADRLEDTVAEHVLADLLRAGAQERLMQVLEDVNAEIVRLREHVATADRRFTELGELHGRGLLVKSAFLAAQKATKQDLKDTRTRLRFLEQIADVPIADVTDFTTWWMTAPRQWQRALIALEVQKVRVLPSGGGRHADPSERIRIDWRTPAN
ncbi:recombinase zinc beta ribbon domain-containing protein [Streptomyces sp. NPDC050636]|uniref:recombinase zinc beta ribbon domain-containing protein n=1 Tax=Streptomyces sp. NPDC050636 TaxID=3154510 RepID=UPI00341AB7AB